jgi:hypothetical protein
MGTNGAGRLHRWNAAVRMLEFQWYRVSRRDKRSMKFEQQFEVTREQQEVWAFFWDLPHLVTCIPGCREATMIEERKRYKATVFERVGPFQVRFDLEVLVQEVQEPVRISATADGKDILTMSRLHVDLAVILAPLHQGRTGVQIVSDVTLFGKLASLGHLIIRPKAQEVMKQFVEAVRVKLAEGERST